MIDIKSLLDIANNDAADNGRTMPVVERDTEREQFERDFSVTGLFECLSQFFDDKSVAFKRSESNADAYEDNEVQAAWVGWQCANPERYKPTETTRYFFVVYTFQTDYKSGGGNILFSRNNYPTMKSIKESIVAGRYCFSEKDIVVTGITELNKLDYEQLIINTPPVEQL